MQRDKLIEIIERHVKGKHERRTIIDAVDVYLLSQNSGKSLVSGGSFQAEYEELCQEITRLQESMMKMGTIAH